MSNTDASSVAPLTRDGRALCVDSEDTTVKDKKEIAAVAVAAMAMYEYIGDGNGPATVTIRKNDWTVVCDPQRLHVRRWLGAHCARPPFVGASLRSGSEIRSRISPREMNIW